MCLSNEMISNGKCNSSTINKLILTVILITTLFQFWYYSNVIENFYDTIRDRSHVIYYDIRGIGSSLFPKLRFENLENGHPNAGPKHNSELLTYNRKSDNGTHKVRKLSSFIANSIKCISDAHTDIYPFFFS